MPLNWRKRRRKMKKIIGSMFVVVFFVVVIFLEVMCVVPNSSFSFFLRGIILTGGFINILIWTYLSILYIRDYRAGKVKKVRGVVVPRHRYDLTKNSLDKEIIASLGGESAVEVTLLGIHELIKLQFNGEAGVLLTDGRTNLFYARDTDGILVALYVNWNNGDWFANISPIEDPVWWLAGCRVFSR